jgi:hypothetical protein
VKNKLSGSVGKPHELMHQPNKITINPALWSYILYVIESFLTCFDSREESDEEKYSEDIDSA